MAEYYVRCSYCGAKVSNVVESSIPEGLVVRALQESTICSQCGGRLFPVTEFWQGRTHRLRECSLGCSRQYHLDGTSVAHQLK